MWSIKMFSMTLAELNDTGYLPLEKPLNLPSPKTYKEYCLKNLLNKGWSPGTQRSEIPQISKQKQTTTEAKITSCF